MKSNSKWGSIKYQHSHVEALWEGWQARAALAEPVRLSEPEIEEIALRDEFWFDPDTPNTFFWGDFARAIEDRIRAKAAAKGVLRSQQPHGEAMSADDALKAAIRTAGGIVHSDGNIFFTSADQFIAASLAVPVPVPPGYRLVDKGALTMALNVLDRAGKSEVAAELRAGCIASPATVEPVAWMTEDGRVATEKTKTSCMPSAASVSFNIPLYTQPRPAMPIDTDELAKEIRRIEFLTSKPAQPTILDAPAHYSSEQASAWAAGVRVGAATAPLASSTLTVYEARRRAGVLPYPDMITQPGRLTERAMRTPEAADADDTPTPPKEPT